MPSVHITQQLYDYLKDNLVDESIDATIRMLINKHDLPLDPFGIDDGMGKSEDSDKNDVPLDNTVVGGKGDSTNSGYIR